MSNPQPVQPHQGEIWFVRIPTDPPDKNARPVIVVSLDARNQHPRASTVLVVPLIDDPERIRYSRPAGARRDRFGRGFRGPSGEHQHGAKGKPGAPALPAPSPERCETWPDCQMCRTGDGDCARRLLSVHLRF